MKQFDIRDRKTKLANFRASLTMLGFGALLLAFLVAIDRPHWFTLRPASGTAAALSRASDNRASEAGTARHAATDRSAPAPSNHETS